MAKCPLKGQKTWFVCQDHTIYIVLLNLKLTGQLPTVSRRPYLFFGLYFDQPLRWSLTRSYNSYDFQTVCEPGVWLIHYSFSDWPVLCVLVICLSPNGHLSLFCFPDMIRPHWCTAYCTETVVMNSWNLKKAAVKWESGIETRYKSTCPPRWTDQKAIKSISNSKILLLKIASRTRHWHGTR